MNDHKLGIFVFSYLKVETLKNSSLLIGIYSKYTRLCDRTVSSYGVERVRVGSRTVSVSTTLRGPKANIFTVL